MENNTTHKNDLEGTIAIKFKKEDLLDDFCSQHIDNFNPERLEVFAIRVFYGKETYITVYATDKGRIENSSSPSDAVPVKKFRLPVSFIQNILPLIDDCNFTVTTGKYPIDAMEVINK